jgi:predicted AAA+ superfamily ATPase
MKPWREIIHPHDDVLDGKFDESEFAADLTKVVRGIAKPEYLDPERFFERTVVTEGMSLLLQSVVKRLGGKGGDPVVQLQTAFGGGKTHTMMAVMHVANDSHGSSGGRTATRWSSTPTRPVRRRARTCSRSC